jgi:serine/threonine-protein kinase
VVRAIVSGEVGPGDLVKKDDSDPRPVSAFPELARHLPPSSRTPTSKVGRKMAKTSETYALDVPFGMLQIFGRAVLARETGLYLCERGPVRKEVYLDDGQPVYVTSNQPDELLGEYLVRRGVLDRAELDMALAVMPRFEGKLGDSLVALGLVEPLMLVRHLTNKVREQLLSVFSWPDGRVSFYRDAAPPESTFNLGFEVWTILDEGAKARVSARLDQEFFEACGRGVTRLGREGAMPLLPPPLATTLYVLSQPRTLAELIRHGEDETRVRQSLLVLAALGAIRPI